MKAEKSLAHEQRGEAPKHEEKGRKKEVWGRIKAYAKGVPARNRPTQASLAEEIKQNVPGADAFASETIIRKIRRHYPDYTPGKRGRKPNASLTNAFM